MQSILVESVKPFPSTREGGALELIRRGGGGREQRDTHLSGAGVQPGESSFGPAGGELPFAPLQLTEDEGMFVQEEALKSGNSYTEALQGGGASGWGARAWDKGLGGEGRGEG